MVNAGDRAGNDYYTQLILTIQVPVFLQSFPKKSFLRATEYIIRDIMGRKAFTAVAYHYN